MKRIAIAGAGIATLLASTAFAAGFDVNNGQAALADVTSGTVSVDDCTNGVTLDVLHGDYDHTQDDWHVTGVRVAGIDTGLGEACDGFEIQAALDVAIPAGLDVTNGFAPTDRLAIDLDSPLEVELPLAEGQTVWASQIVDVSLTVDQPQLRPTRLVSYVSSWVNDGPATNQGTSYGSYNYWYYDYYGYYYSNYSYYYYYYYRDVTTTYSQPMTPVLTEVELRRDEQAPDDAACPQTTQTTGSTNYTSYSYYYGYYYSNYYYYYDRPVTVTNFSCVA